MTSARTGGRRAVRSAYAATLLLLGMAGRMIAADYYVAPGGLDSNAGSQALPWQTIQKAADALAPGDTVFVRAGTYAMVTVNVSGSAAGGYVTFINYPGETPVIDAAGVTPPGEDTALFLLVNRSFVIIEGFELRNYKTADATLTPAGIFLGGACRHVQIRGCNVHDIWNTGGDLSNPGNAFGIAVYGSSFTPANDVTIDGNDVHDLRTGSSESLVLNGNVVHFRVTNNRVHDNNNIGIDFIGYEKTCPDPAQDQARDGLCMGNEIWNITSQGNQAYADGDYSADGIYCDGAARVTIKRNRVHDNDIGIELASEHPGELTSGIKVRKNFVSANRQTGLFLGGFAREGTGGADGCLIKGNTFYADDTLLSNNGEVQLRFRTTNCVLTGNTIVSGSGNWLVTVPVSGADNVHNMLDANLYYCPAGPDGSLWRWNGRRQTGFTTWQNASGQDVNSSFASDPPTPRRASKTR